MTTQVQFELRRDTAANWLINNPILLPGEPGFDSTNNQLRIGNGVTGWNYLDQVDVKTNAAISIGRGAGDTQGIAGVAIGSSAGYAQADGSVAIGASSGQIQAIDSIAIGSGSGTNQAANSIAIGSGAGSVQDVNCIAIGSGAGLIQEIASIAIGSGSGNNQAADSIAIGKLAGEIQGIGSVAIGAGSGGTQGIGGIAIGNGAGLSQADSSVAIGSSAGTNQGTQSVAVGENAAMFSSSNQSVSIGYREGYTGQADSAVAIGFQAGYEYQGISSIAIGNLAGNSGQANYTTIINASSDELNGVPGQTGRFYVAPIRQDNSQTLALAYNTSTKEIVTSTAAGGGGVGPLNPYASFVKYNATGSGYQDINPQNSATVPNFPNRADISTISYWTQTPPATINGVKSIYCGGSIVTLTDLAGPAGETEFAAGFIPTVTGLYQISANFMLGAGEPEPISFGHWNLSGGDYVSLDRLSATVINPNNTAVPLTASMSFADILTKEKPYVFVGGGYTALGNNLRVYDNSQATFTLLSTNVTAID